MRNQPLQLVLAGSTSALEHAPRARHRAALCSHQHAALVVVSATGTGRYHR